MVKVSMIHLMLRRLKPDISKKPNPFHYPRNLRKLRGKPLRDFREDKLPLKIVVSPWGTHQRRDVVTNRFKASPAFQPEIMAIVGKSEHLVGLDSLISEYCHTLRNRLNSVSLSIYLARRGGSYSMEEGLQLDRAYRRIERLVDQFQWLCRPSEINLMALDLGLLLEDQRTIWEGLFFSHDCVLELAENSHCLEGLVDPCRVIRALDALVTWRSEVADPGILVVISCEIDEDEFLVTWSETKRVCGDSASNEEEAESLVLGILGRVMADHSGTLCLTGGDSFGLSLRWPTRARTDGNSLPARPAARPPLTGHASLA